MRVREEGGTFTHVIEQTHSNAHLESVSLMSIFTHPLLSPFTRQKCFFFLSLSLVWFRFIARYGTTHTHTRARLSVHVILYLSTSPIFASKFLIPSAGLHIGKS